MRLVSTITMLVLLACGPALAAKGGKPPEKLDPQGSCSTAECHGDLLARPKVHAPVAGNECTTCHEAVGDKHEFKPMPKSTELCMGCHEPMVAGETVHPPAAEDCLNCHDPHGSKIAGLMKKDTQREVCFSCHDSAIAGGKYQHGPVGVGTCSGCHKPHSSKEEKFLVAPKAELCVKCHEELVKAMAGAKSVHEPAAKDCSTCHDPHSGPQPKMLKMPVRELCASCHAETVKNTTEAAVPHGPAKSETGCVDCHSPHSSADAPLLRKPQPDLCFGCHNKVIDSPSGKLVNMAALLKSNKDWHGPVRDGCTGCHEVHGGKNFRLLAEAYPAKFYSPFSAENYALCFTCHEASLVTEKTTRSLTDFRDGDRNLHYVHVNSAERGRTCRACHDVHASSNPHHIRDNVRYGQWDLPINFQLTETGGSCAPGCHTKATYNNKKNP